MTLGAAGGAFGHIHTPVSEAEERDRSPTNKNAPARRRRGRSVAVLKVKLTGHAVGDPPVIWTPSGCMALGRIGTSFSYRIEA